MPTKVTVPPTDAPYVGLELEIVELSAIPLTLKDVAKVLTPPADVTVMTPVVALAGTAVRIVVAL